METLQYDNITLAYYDNKILYINTLWDSNIKYMNKIKKFVNSLSIPYVNYVTKEQFKKEIILNNKINYFNLMEVIK